MKKYLLKYDKPSEFNHKGWENYSLPIGNGYMGMNVFGRTDTEYLQINEKTLWSGGPSKDRPDYNGGNLKDKAKYLKEMQESLKAKDQTKTQSLIKHLVGISEGYGNYLNFGYLKIDFNHNETKEYKRTLDLNEGVATVEYENCGVKYKRTHFANYPDNLLITKIEADKKAFNCELSFTELQEGAKVTAEKDKIIIKGRVKDNDLFYYGILKIESDGEINATDETLTVKEAQYLNIYIALGTDYKNQYPKYRGESPISNVEKRIEKYEKGINVLLSEHKADYKSLFNRNQVEFSDSESILNTDQLLQKYKENQLPENDKRYLEEILYQYGRYLIIGSSRTGTLPANLQGVWNDSNNPPWGSDYHLNVNLQMCYWHLYSGNLCELAMPLIEYMESLRIPGRITAKEYHGIESKENEENGWVCHVQNTPFGWTCPGWEFYWGWSPASSSWMMLNLYDYYAYTKDEDTLRKFIYPTMKENAKFWLKSLIYDKNQDRYVSSPSFSPEHGPISTGNTYEQELIYLLFSHTVKCGKILNEDKDFVKELELVKDKLKPLHIGKFGQIKEWYEEDDWHSNIKLIRILKGSKRRVQYKHRHMSHMLGLYPGNHITEQDKELFNASKVSLSDRGLGTKTGMNQSGWSKTNKMLLWARVKEGNKSYELLTSLIKNNIANNLWDLHPPYQMDGNCGFTAAVGEMLLYSNEEYIELLPALPDCWKNGKVKGLLAKGGFELDFEWKDSKVISCDIRSINGEKAVLKLNGALVEVSTVKKQLKAI